MSDQAETKVAEESVEETQAEEQAIPAPEPEEAQVGKAIEAPATLVAPTLIENLKSTRATLVDKLALINDAIEIAENNSEITDFNSIMAEFQKLRA